MLADDLARLLERSPDLTAAELSEALHGNPDRQLPGRHERSVALALHSDSIRFETDGSTPPKWHLARPIGRQPPAGRAVPTSDAVWGALPAPYAWQAEALRAWRAAGRRAVIEAVTGAGKTLIGLMAAKQELQQGGQVLVLVPSLELMRQWQKLIVPILPTGYRVGCLGGGDSATLTGCDMVVGVVNSVRASDVRPIRASALLVADECHRYGSPTNRLALGARFPHRLGLSATYARDDGGHLSWLDPYFSRTCFRLGYERAVREGVTARFRVALLAVPLSETERVAYVEVSESIRVRAARLTARFGLPTHPFDAFLRAVLSLAATDDGDRQAGRSDARAYLAALNQRRRLLSEAQAKLSVLAGLAPALGTAHRAIIFGRSIRSSVAAAEVIAVAGVPTATIHSGMGRAERQAVMSAFASGSLKVLAAPQVLDEGIDVPEADLAVVLSASRSRRQMIQRMGRVLRVKPDGRLASFVIVFAEGTIEDPAHGNAEAFLEEMLPVAQEVRRFEVRTAGASHPVLGFLGVGDVPPVTRLSPVRE